MNRPKTPTRLMAKRILNRSTIYRNICNFLLFTDLHNGKKHKMFRQLFSSDTEMIIDYCCCSSYSAMENESINETITTENDCYVILITFSLSRWKHWWPANSQPDWNIAGQDDTPVNWTTEHRVICPIWKTKIHKSCAHFPFIIFLDHFNVPSMWLS